MLLDNTYGNSLNLKVIALVIYFKQNINSKIQMLARKATEAYYFEEPD